MDESPLADWNPWWNTGKVPSNWLGHTRDDLTLLERQIQSRDITIVTGVRRSGKTTLLFQMIDRLIRSGADPNNILFANLNDASFTGVSLESIQDAYFQMHQPNGKVYYLLDEVQEIDGWERWALKGYELKREQKVVATGSSSVLLTGGYSSILTGRTNTLKVFPLNYREYLSFNGSSLPEHPTSDDRNRAIFHLERYLRAGGFPELQVRRDIIPENVLSGYFSDILVRDVLLHNKVDAASIIRFSKYIMTNISNPLTLRALKNATGLSLDTVKAYISILEKVYLLWTVPHFSFSNKQSIEDQRPKKYYCIDNGMRNAVSFKFSDDIGRLSENLVFLELKKRERGIGYWKGSNEIDFVSMDKEGRIELINVCYSDSIPEREFTGLNEFISKEGTSKITSKILTRNTEEEQGDVELVPLWKWLLRS